MVAKKTTGIFGTYVPPSIFPRKPEKKPNKSKLTQTQKSKIKKIVGKCEIPKCPNGAYEVHHIKFVENNGKDTYGNLIVLCSIHHDDAHGKNPDGKNILKPKLFGIVKKRKKTTADQIKNILPKKKKIDKNPNDLPPGYSLRV